ncbi:MAG TPA: sulfurtransferase [Burkholderiales bacterium]|nr:sulfurtransferase [Burkholderiales bacterium]
MSYGTIVSTQELAAHLDDPSWIIFDCRHELMDHDAGARAYAQSHVPGARFAHSERDLAGPKTGRNGRHPLPDPQTFIAWLGRNGVDNGKQVVAYDFSAGSASARLWWMLRWLGHETVAALDGGWEAWVRAGLPVTREVPQPSPTAFRGQPHGDRWVDVEFIRSHLDDASMIVVDARSAERFRGVTEPIDAVAGHIPGARNRPFKENLGPDGRFKPAAELRNAFAAMLAGGRPEQVVHQCGSGVSACSNLLAMEIAGLRGSRLYPGSWSEWIADAARPIARE